MIHTRNICKQVDMTDEDMSILIGLKLACEPRKADRRDFHIMRCRDAARVRGYKSPIEVEKSIFNVADKDG